MNATSILLVLSVAMNVVLAGVLWQRARTPEMGKTRSPYEAMAPPAAIIEPKLDPELPPRITVGGSSPFLQFDESESGKLSAIGADEESPFRAINPSAAVPVPSPRFVPQRIKEALIDTEPMRSAELSKPYIMWQVPPRLDLKPGRSTPFSEPHWNESPVRHHGFEK